MSDLIEQMPLTDRELAALDRLWRHGASTISELREADGIDQPYTSTLSVYQQLRDKGLVTVEGKEGAAYLWQPTHTKEQLRASALRWVTETLYGGDALQMSSDASKTANAFTSSLRELAGV